MSELKSSEHAMRRYHFAIRTQSRDLTKLRGNTSIQRIVRKIDSTKVGKRAEFRRHASKETTVRHVQDDYKAARKASSKS